MPEQVLLTPLPSRWGWAQWAKNTLIYGLVRMASATLGFVPRPLGAVLGTWLGCVAHGCAAHERRLALRQLAMAMPYASLTTRQGICRRMFEHLGQAAFELARADVWLRDPEGLVFDTQARATLDAAMAEGRGVMAVTGHIGNWELLAQALAQAGYPLWTVAKPLYDPRLTRWAHAQRTRRGLRVIWRGDVTAARDLIGVFRRGHMLGMLIDQDTKVDTVRVPFFGAEAATPRAAATLALRFAAPVVLIWAHRQGQHHKVNCRRVDMAALPHDADTVTAHLTAELEKVISSQPEQWVWLHRRWKSTDQGRCFAPPRTRSTNKSTEPAL